MINRTAKGGSWKKQGNDRRITGCSGEKIGGRRIFTFYLPKKQKTDWVIHEYYLTKADSDEQIGDFVLCRLKDNRLKKKSGKPDHDRQDAPLCDEDQAFSELGHVVVIPKGNDDEAKAEHGGGSCSMASNVESPCGNDDNAELGGGSRHIVPVMLTKAEEYQGFNALKDAVFGSNGNEQEFGGSQTGPYIIKNDRSVSIEGQPDSEMVKELLHKPVDLALPHPPPSTQLQSPIYTKLGTNNSLNDEYHKRKCPFGDSEPSLTKKNHTDEVDSNTSSNSENQPADPIPKGCSQPGGNLESDLFRSQTPPSIIREPRDLPHDNDSIEWDDLPSITEGFFSCEFLRYSY